MSLRGAKAAKLDRVIFVRHTHADRLATRLRRDSEIGTAKLAPERWPTARSPSLPQVASHRDRKLPEHRSPPCRQTARAAANGAHGHLGRPIRGSL